MHEEEIFGRILQEERKAKKISQEKLAKLAGLDRTFIRPHRKRKTEPDFFYDSENLFCSRNRSF